MVKIFLTLLIISPITTMACDVSVTLAEAQRIIDANAMTDVRACKLMAKGCQCVDGIYWETAEVVNGVIQNNPKKLADFLALQEKMRQDAADRDAAKAQLEASVSAAKDAIKSASTAAEKISALINYIKLRDGI